MSRFILLVALTLGTFFAVHLVGTGLAAGASRALRRPRGAAARARLALALRLAPTAGAFVLALLVGLAFGRHEPPDTGERAGPLLLTAGALGAWLALSGAARTVRALLVTRRLVREWCSRARPLVLAGAPAPAHRIEHAFPVVAVVGLFRPRLFLAGSVLDRLSAAELRAVLEHERAHVDRRDNLKRWLVRSCPDLPGLGGPGERLRREWEEASEEVADDRSAHRGRRAASRLAAALVKVARLTPRGARLSGSAIALLSESNLRGRVERLLSVEDLPAPPRGRKRAARWLAPALLIILAAGLPRLLTSVHAFLEAVVQALS